MNGLVGGPLLVGGLQARAPTGPLKSGPENNMSLSFASCCHTSQIPTELNVFTVLKPEKKLYIFRKIKAMW